MHKTSPKKMVFQMNNLREIPLHSFPSENIEKSLNLITYGLKIQKHFKSSAKFFHNRLFYILEDDLDYLQWLSHSKPYNRARIDLKTIKNITDDPHFDSKLLILFEKIKDLTQMLFISYGEINQNKVLILKFKEPKLKLSFWQGLQYLTNQAIERDSCFGDVKKVLAKKLFLKADKDGNKMLDFEEVKKILQQLHIEIKHGFLVKFFDKYDKDKNKMIDWEEFQAIIDDISLKPELKPIFLKYCSQKKQSLNNYNNEETDAEQSRMKFEEFRLFLNKEQKQEISEEEFCQLLYLIHSDTPPTGTLDDLKGQKSFTEEKKKLSINFSEFCSIIFSRNNEIFDPEKLEIYQDMSRPLCDYYINSSHNTYLLANQLTSDSSTKAYVNAFAKGCRCVELDCWDGEKDEPMIYHGYTFTSKILFREVVQTIKNYAFISNPYPVILSLENHCNEKQQEKMAEIFEQVLGDSLYKLPENYQDFEKFPSPNELKYKILIKDKAKLPFLSLGESCKGFKVDWESLEQTDQLCCDDDEGYVSEKMINFLNMQTSNEWGFSQKHFLPSSQSISKSIKEKMPLQKHSQFKKKPLEMVSLPENITVQRAIEETNSQIEFKDSKSKSQKITNKLKKLLVFYAVKMNLLLPRSIWNISSIRETVFDKLAKEKEDHLQDFHSHYFLRVYPAGTRIDSSNYDPIKCFNFGTQMIALNVQQPDYALLLYLSRFRENGDTKCGYILKPEFLLRQQPRYIREFSKICKILHITVISAQQLRPEKENDVRDVVDPYVEVSLRGTSFDEKENAKPYKSPVIENNGFNPQFALKCQFKLCCPEMVMIVFKVFDQEITINDMKIGWNAVPFGCLRPGFRIVPLLNSNLDVLEFSYLLVKVEIYDVIQET